MGNCAGIQHEQTNITDFLRQGSTLESMTLDKLVMKRQETQMAYKRTLTKNEIYESLSSRRLSSGIFLQMRLVTTVPATVTDYNLEYDVKYSTHQQAWNENDIKTANHVSRPHELEYAFNAEKQNVSSIIPVPHSSILDYC
jgi:hypothetical protein